MASTPTITIDSGATGRDTAVGRQIRGSSLLLVGRFGAKGINFAAGVMVVRCLSQSDYGAFAYALSLVLFGQDLARFGLNRAITRFLPIYHERKEYDKLFGTLVMVSATVLSIGLAIALFVYAARGLLAESWVSDPRTLSLLLVLIFLAPVEAFEQLLLGMFAVFASPRTIFLRRYLLGPALKLAVVLLLVLGSRGVLFLACGYVVAAILGVAVSVTVLLRCLRQQGLAAHFHVRSLTMPWKEIFFFTIPLMTSELVHVVMHTADVIVVRHYAGLDEVAALRAVQPLAIMNQLVMASFATLFTPLASRMFARGDRRGINQLYWQTAVWIAVFSFPIFVVTFSISGPITELFYGARYQQSAILLSLLSLGSFFNAALGFNGLTLKVYGKLRSIVLINVSAAALNLVLILLLVPRYGALGAAMGTCVSLIVHNVLKHAGLWFGTDIRLFDWRCTKVYLIIVVVAGVLLAVQAAVNPPIYVSLAMAALASLAVLRLSRDALNAVEIFPEVMRLPLVRQLLGRKEG